MTGAVETPVGKKSTTDEKYLAVKISASVVSQARTICGYRGKTIAEFLSNLLRPIVAQEYERFRKDVNAGKPPKIPDDPKKPHDKQNG